MACIAILFIFGDCMNILVAIRHQNFDSELLQRFAIKLIWYIKEHLSLQKNILVLSRQIFFLVVPLILFFLQLTLISSEQARASGITYTVSQVAVLPIGSTRVVRMANDNGMIVGTFRGNNSGPRGTFWDDGGRHEIKGLKAATDSDYNSALGINNKGQIVGSMNTDTGMRAFISQGGSDRIFLDQLPGDTSSAAFAISFIGMATGWSSGPNGVRAVIWSSSGTVQALAMLPDSKSCRGLAINNKGGVVGSCDTAAGSRAVFWEGGSSDKAAQDLGTLPGDYWSTASSINNNGDIVGTSGGIDNRHNAVLWIKGNVIKDLGTLPNLISSKALAINNQGTVVGVSEGSNGERAFIWRDQEGMQDLNDLLSSNSNFVLTHAVSVSSLGNVTAIGHDKINPDGQEHDAHQLPLQIFRLNPVRGR
ncbi:MAG: hypothetical protein JSR71_14280 [Proteobacteria bacterium]|nr:hypothetical protein [Pseudomonadota bacterium]